MIKTSKPSSKKTVELEAEARPSRIRRDPVPSDKPVSLVSKIQNSREWEIKLAIAGIVFTALAINAVVFDLGELLSH
ncbi:MAG: hypothetical protein V4502_09560 [Pseudomonadota bacterium]